MCAALCIKLCKGELVWDGVADPPACPRRPPSAAWHLCQLIPQLRLLDFYAPSIPASGMPVQGVPKRVPSSLSLHYCFYPIWEPRTVRCPLSQETLKLPSHLAAFFY